MASEDDALAKQVDGGHYKACKIQPIEYIYANQLGFCEANVVKYVTRHRAKNGKKDIEKAIHYLELLLQLEYTEGGNGNESQGQQRGSECGAASRNSHYDSNGGRSGHHAGDSQEARSTASLHPGSDERT